MEYVSPAELLWRTESNVSGLPSASWTKVTCKGAALTNPTMAVIQTSILVIEKSLLLRCSLLIGHGESRFATAQFL